MWNSHRTDQPHKITAEIATYAAGNGDSIHAYVARPDGLGPFPGIVLIHHMPGWNELYREFARRWADHGYYVICPDLYCRSGHGVPEDVTAAIRAAGGVPDDQVVADLEAALKWLKSRPECSGKIGITGTCSGGRHTTLVVGRVKGFAAAINCWGGGVVAAKDQLTPQRPVAPIDYVKNIDCPLLGIFGNEDQSPTPEQVNQLEAALKEHGKEHEFHRYDGAGHGFIYYDRANYRPQQAMDAWAKMFAFFDKHLKA